MRRKDYTTGSGNVDKLLRSVVILVSAVLTANAIEEPPYVLEKKDHDFEVRAYKPQLVAETVVTGSLEAAGDKGFSPLFRYISGDNRSKTKIPMTSPVGQERRESEKIPMTAPVGQTASSNGWSVTFTMPSTYTMASLPEPTDKRVRLRAIPAARMAAVRYSGRWSQKGYDRNLKRLRAWMKTQGLAPAGEPVWARYNAPFSLPFLRRNEVLIPLAAN